MNLGFAGMIRIPEGAAPDTKNKDFNITAYVTLSSDSDSGVLATIGGRFGGWVLYMKDGYFHYVHNYVGLAHYVVSSPATISQGDHVLSMIFDYDGGGYGLGKFMRCPFPDYTSFF